MKRFLSVCILLLLGSNLGFCGRTNDSYYALTIEGQWPSVPRGGVCQAVVSDDKVFMACGNAGLMIASIQNRTHPVILSILQVGGFASGVAVAGSKAYVSGDFGLTVADVSDVQHPKVLGKVGLSDIGGPDFMMGSGIQVIDHFAYLSPHSLQIAYPTAVVPGGMLVVVDVLDPANPSVVGLCRPLSSSTSFFIADVSDPTSPQIKGSYGTNGPRFSARISGNYAYLAEGSSGVTALNIKNPFSPKKLGAYQTVGIASDIQIVGNDALVAAGTQGMLILDINYPDTPKAIGIAATAGAATGLSVSGTNVYIAQGSAGMCVAEFHSPAVPTIVSILQTDGNSSLVIMQGTNTLVADYPQGIQVLDTHDYSNPSLLTTIPYSQKVLDMARSGSFLYWISSSGLKAATVASPDSPQILAAVAVQNPAGIWLANNLAYLACGSSGMRIYDFSSISNPRLMGSFDTSGNAQSIAVRGRYAYIADGSSGICIADVFNSTVPYRAATWPVVSQKLLISGDYLFSLDGGLTICSLAAPLQPQKIAGIAGTFQDVFYESNHLYAAMGTNGLAVFNLETPSAPRLLGSLHTSGFASAISVDKGHIAVAVGDKGVLFVKEMRQNPDVDSDGIPDEWEINYAGSIDVLGRYSDYDHDGTTDWAEYITDTNPIDSNSVLKIQFVKKSSNQSILLQWNSVSNRSYQVWASANSVNAFTLLKENIVSTPPTNQISIPLNTNVQFQFYRIGTALP